MWDRVQRLHEYHGDDVEHEGQLVWDAEIGDQPNESLAQVRDRSLTTVTFAVGADAGPQ